MSETVGVAPEQHPLPRQLVHELRTPLNQIIGYTELMLEEAEEAGHDAYLVHLQKVTAAAYRLLALFDQSFTGSVTPDVASAALEVLLKSEVTLEEDGEGKLIVPEPPQAPDNGTSLLLVVDDVEANRDILARRLARDGYGVATAVNGVEAMAMLEAGSYDLVLCDIMMPEMDGYEVLERMKADDRLRHVPIIMISALNEVDSAARCIELGAEDYLPKPFNPTLLKARITTSLEKKRAHEREASLVEKLQATLSALKKKADAPS